MEKESKIERIETDVDLRQEKVTEQGPKVETLEETIKKLMNVAARLRVVVGWYESSLNTDGISEQDQELLKSETANLSEINQVLTDIRERKEDQYEDKV